MSERVNGEHTTVSEDEYLRERSQAIPPSLMVPDTVYCLRMMKRRERTPDNFAFDVDYVVQGIQNDGKYTWLFTHQDESIEPSVSIRLLDAEGFLQRGPSGDPYFRQVEPNPDRLPTAEGGYFLANVDWDSLEDIEIPAMVGATATGFATEQY